MSAALIWARAPILATLATLADGVAQGSAAAPSSRAAVAHYMPAQALR
jgi:hypothetical protein